MFGIVILGLGEECVWEEYVEVGRVERGKEFGFWWYCWVLDWINWRDK